MEEECKTEGALVQNFMYLFGRSVKGVIGKLQLGPYSLLLYSDKNIGKKRCLVKGTIPLLCGRLQAVAAAAP